MSSPRSGNMAPAGSVEEPIAARPEVLIQALRRPELYPHPADPVELVETHISWLLMAGSFVYKIKKPVNLGFLDFTRLQQRKFYCEEELRLNRRFSPELYLEVVPIAGSPEAPRLGADGPAIEYAVKMVRFPDEARLDRVVARGEFTAAHADSLAEMIAEAHAIAAATEPQNEFATPERIRQQTDDALALAERELPAAEQPALAHLRAFCDAEFSRLRPLLAERKQSGFVRECHGDLHLENMLLAGGRVRLFDCLEFNPLLRWIDVMSDVAFATMDLADRGHPELSARLLNRYLELTGDYAGLAVLNYYQVYRAVVRAAVAGIRLQQPELSPQARQKFERRADVYLRLAAGYAQPRRALLAITHGLSGTGKSTFTGRLLERLPAVRLRSDVERRRLEARSSAAISAAERYSVEARRSVYRQMAATSRQILEAGHSAIVDATFLRRDDRRLFQQLAGRLGIPLVILCFERPQQELAERIERRARDQSDPSEATIEIVAQQRRELEPLAPDEHRTATVLDAAAADLETIVARLQGLAAAPSAG